MTALIERRVHRRAFAHWGLRDLIVDKATKGDLNSDDIGFLAPEQLMSEVGADIPVIVPAMDEMQARFITRLRERMCLAPILAIVNDLSGHQTHRAMMSGATSVLNLELPDDKQNSVLRTLFESCHLTSAATPRLHCVTEPQACDQERLDEHESPENRELLAKLLCSSATIAAISRQFYCSERSMYRRVRRLYDHFGVTGRAELRTLIDSTK